MFTSDYQGGCYGRHEKATGRNNDVPLTESELDKAVGGDKTSVSHEGFVIVKPVDIASPKLYD
jgi:type VI protein secretion system component Hcp